MKGKWVWAVNMRIGKVEGTNSVYSDKGMAERKAKRLNDEIMVHMPKSNQKAIIRRVMYFKDSVNEDSFDDYCSICGGQLKKKEQFSEIRKSSLNKP